MLSVAHSVHIKRLLQDDLYVYCFAAVSPGSTVMSSKRSFTMAFGQPMDKSFCGATYVVAMLDTYNDVIETHEDNNLALSKLTLLCPDGKHSSSTYLQVDFENCINI